MVKPGIVDRFAAGARAAGAEILRAATLGDAVEAVCALLKNEEIVSAVVSPSARSSGFTTEAPFRQPGTAREFANAQAGIVRADYGAAETGTLVHLDEDDGEKLGWTLPPLCLCLLDEAAIVEDLESLGPVFSAHLERMVKPGPQVSLVTGPSRTADIECSLTIGVHGPARLVIVLFGNEGLP